MISTKRRSVLFIVLVIIAAIFLILSFTFDFFFFFPIFCILPFSCRRRSYFRDTQDNQAEAQTQPPQEVREVQKESGSSKEFKSELKKRFCPVCGGEIKEPNVKFCYFCGSRLSKV